MGVAGGLGRHIEKNAVRVDEANVRALANEGNRGALGDVHAKVVREEPQKKGLTSWLFSGLKKEQDAGTGGDGSPRHSGVAVAAAAAAADDTQSSIKDKAKAAFDKEKENQRQGGPLDRLGVSGEGGKKGGWW